MKLFYSFSNVFFREVRICSMRYQEVSQTMSNCPNQIAEAMPDHERKVMLNHASRVQGNHARAVQQKRDTKARRDVCGQV